MISPQTLNPRLAGRGAQGAGARAQAPAACGCTVDGQACDAAVEAGGVPARSRCACHDVWHPTLPPDPRAPLLEARIGSTARAGPAERVHAARRGDHPNRYQCFLADVAQHRELHNSRIPWQHELGCTTAAPASAAALTLGRLRPPRLEHACAQPARKRSSPFSVATAVRAPAAQGRNQVLRVMTWNVHFWRAGFSATETGDNRAAVVEAVRRYAPDMCVRSPPTAPATRDGRWEKG